MEQPSLWETIFLGGLALLVIFWFRPGIAATLERSRKAPKDWAGALIPIAVVVLFILFLVKIT